MLRMTEKSSFRMYYSIGMGWKPYVTSEDAKDLRAAKKHIKRIQRRKMFGAFPSHRYTVCVTTKFFGFVHSYTLKSA